MAGNSNVSGEVVIQSLVCSVVGVVTYYFDAEARTLAQPTKKIRSVGDLRSTCIIRAKGIANCHAADGECLVMDIPSGEILAAVTEIPSVSLRSGEASLPLQIRFKPFLPGASFQIVPSIGALEEKMTTDGENIINCLGILYIGDTVVREAHQAHGRVDLSRMFCQSCTVATATLAEKIGNTRMFAWSEKLGFGHVTGIECTHEPTGTLPPLGTRTPTILAQVGCGEALTVTAPQLLAAYAAIANDGQWIQPHFRQSMLAAEGKVTPILAPHRQVCSHATAALVTKYLEGVVTDSTGRAAAIPHCRVAGQTGTVCIRTPDGKLTNTGTAVFVGFFPVEKPRFAILVVLNNPKTAHFGGVVAAPIAREVGQYLLASTQPARH